MHMQPTEWALKRWFSYMHTPYKTCISSFSSLIINHNPYVREWSCSAALMYMYVHMHTLCNVSCSEEVGHASRDPLRMQLFLHHFCISGYPALRVTIDYGVARSQPIVCAMSEKCPRGSPTFLTPTRPRMRAGGRPTYNKFPPARCTCTNVYVHVRIEGHMTYDACPASSEPVASSKQGEHFCELCCNILCCTRKTRTLSCCCFYHWLVEYCNIFRLEKKIL